MNERRDMMSMENLQFPVERIKDFCRKWKITEMALFGSVLRDDFRPDSDVDVLITLAPDHGWGLADVVDMEEELERMLGRDVDLVLKGGLRNPFRRREILKTQRVIYAA